MDKTNDLKKEVGELKKRIEKLEKRYTFDNSPDELINKPIELLKGASEISASFLQRRLTIGYSRAARLLDQLEEKGFLGKAEGGKPRKVIKSNTE